MFFNKAINLRIVRLIMQETGTYNTQFVRPYNTHVGVEELNAITECVVNSQGGRFSANALSGVSGGFIAPQTNPESSVNIANGWDTPRVRFLMEVECQFQIGGGASIYIQGYTNFPGVSSTAGVAPDMEFYINSMITTKKTQISTPFGVQVVESVSDNSHLLCDNNWRSMMQPGQAQIMRPEDVFVTMLHSHIPSNFDDAPGNFSDARTALVAEAKKSNRANGLPASYAAKILDGYTVGCKLADFGQSEEAIINNSRGEVKESQAATDPFLHAMSNITGYGIRNKFRMADLQKLDPNVMNVTKYAINGPTQVATQHRAGQTENWHGTDRTTIVATILSQSIPAIMMELMINQIAFVSSNYDITGNMNTTIVNGKSFYNGDMTRHYEMFIRRLEREVLQDITFNNQIGYGIEMKIDLMGETWIKISLDGKPEVDYVTPSFCDNLFVPVITANQETFQNLSNDFSNLVSHVKEAIGSSNMHDNIITTV